MLKQFSFRHSENFVITKKVGHSSRPCKKSFSQLASPAASHTSLFALGGATVALHLLFTTLIALVINPCRLGTQGSTGGSKITTICQARQVSECLFILNELTRSLDKQDEGRDSYEGTICVRKILFIKYLLSALYQLTRTSECILVLGYVDLSP